MTGYAKVQSTFGDKKLNIEIKTLNSKQLDLIVKVPAAYRSRELDIRTMLGRLERGKVECYFTEENGSAEGATFNRDLLVSRFNDLYPVADSLAAIGADSRPALFNSLLSMSDIWNSAADNEISDDDWAVVSADLQRAIETLLSWRNGHRIKRYMADAAIKDVDENRFEQELIYYLEKLDITEEKVRLQKHIDYFRQTMADEPSCGKKLGFVAQEMGREINTTGSKANHAGIQKIVVEMKDELEKIKEQLGNVL